MTTPFRFLRSASRRLAEDLLACIAPPLCPSCGDLLREREVAYCGRCRASLTPAPWPRQLLEELGAVFSKDELALSALGSLYSFEKHGPVQHLLHALKYRGCYNLGVELGRELGTALRQFPEFESVELIVPVPLHRARLRERGYNQAAAIAAGLADRLGTPAASDAASRVRATGSQTTLSAGSRRANVSTAFLGDRRRVDGRTVLLCDDVCTTGATLNACADALLLAGAATVCAATVAKDLLGGGTRVLTLPEYPSSADCSAPGSFT